MSDQELEKPGRRVGIKLITSPHHLGLGVIPSIPFPATKAERTVAEKEAAKAALLLSKPSPGQLALFRYLTEMSPDRTYFISSSKWLDTILKATRNLSEAEMSQLHGFDWNERTVSAVQLRDQLMDLLRRKSA